MGRLAGLLVFLARSLSGLALSPVSWSGWVGYPGSLGWDEMGCALRGVVRFFCGF
jgi:hypothetical protein